MSTRQKFSLIFLCFLLISFNLCFSQAKLRKSNLRPYLKVTWPNGGQTYTKGKHIDIRWQSNLIKGNVKIKLKWGTGGGGWFPITDSTANDGKYRYDIPEKGIGRHGNQFRIFVMTLDEKIRDASDSMFTILNKPITPQVDLTCKLSTYFNRKRGTIFFRIRIKNKGTRTLRNVLFNYVIIQKGRIVKQDGAGFGLMLPGVWYDAENEFKPEARINYTIKLFVDPDNKQREPARLRGDNTASKEGRAWTK